jgi:hypothetical protein
MCGYLQVWVSPVASKDFWIGSGRRRLDQVIPELTKSKKNLVQVSVECLNGLLKD